MHFSTASTLSLCASILSLPWASANPLVSSDNQNGFARREPGEVALPSSGTGNASIAAGNSSIAAGNFSIASGNASLLVDPDSFDQSNNITGEDNCSGDHYCSWNPILSGGVVQTDCIAAYEKFLFYNSYARYTQYSTGHCRAIFECIPTQYYGGARVQYEFDHIYQTQPCKKCGEHYFVSHISQI
jgi:hypothetical protein